MSFQNQTDEELMKDYIAGHEQAFEELALRYEKPILNFVYPYFRNQSICEDITQDIFVRLVESKEKYNPERPFKPWLYQIARNRVYDELRKKKRWSLRLFQPKQETELPQSIGAVPDPSLSPRETLNQSRLRDLLLESIQSLDDKSRDMVILRHLQGLSVREVADILGLPEGTVQSGTYRALQSLEKSLIHKGISQEDLR